MGVRPFELECRVKRGLWWSNMELDNSHRITELLETRRNLNPTHWTWVDIHICYLPSLFLKTFGQEWFYLVTCHPFQHYTALMIAIFTCSSINITRNHALKNVFELGSKASCGVSNNPKKNIFLIVSYFLGPNESAWTAAAAFPFSLPSIKEIESWGSKLVVP